MTASDVQRALRTKSSPDRAVNSARFFKTGPGQYGEGDQFIGVTVPEQRSVARQFRDLPVPEIRKLLASPIHEDRLTGLFILVSHYQNAKKTSNEEQFVNLYLDERARINNWDLVDSSAPYILGDWLASHPNKQPILATLATDSSLWSQRIAVLATAAFIQHGNYKPTLELAKQFLTHPHDLMHKAVGWMLREIGKKDQRILKEFLADYASTMPRTMLRYAIEKFNPEERRAYLAIKTNK